MKKTRVTIDPGLAGTGVSVWDDKHWTRLVPPTFCRVLNVSSKASIEDRSYEMAMLVAKIIRDTGDCQTTYIEMPEHWGTQRGAVAEQSGALLKLCVLIGTMNGLFPEDVILIPVRDWKGQMSKKSVENRVRRKIGADVYTKLGVKTHAIDAVGIGLHLKGHFG